MILIVDQILEKVERRKTRKFMNLAFNSNEKKLNESKTNSSPSEKKEAFQKI